MTAPDSVAVNFRDMLAQTETLLAKVQAVTPAEAKATYATFFVAEAATYAERAKVCRKAADAMQSVADAMLAKLGRLPA
jgi:acyl-CoA reductase-like NAD-dependent aldehyde dehydrogenase